MTPHAPASASVTCADTLKDSLSLLEGRFAESTVDLDDGSIVSYRSCGRGPVIVLLHGISSGAASWLQCALRLEKDAQVIAWNAPGYGRSTALPQMQPSAADYAARLELFLQALGVNNCLLVGHSLGAMMAAAYVGGSGGGKRASRLLLVSPAQGYGSDAKRERGRQIAQERLDVLRAIGVEGMAERSPARMLSAQAGDAERAWVRWNIQWLNPAGYTQAVHMLCGDALQAYAPNGMLGHVPATVCCGAEDVVTSADDSRELAWNLNLPFHLIDNAGHACYIEQAGAVAAAIRRQLSGHPYQLS
ncbi:alpha/beta hydrolase [Herbaspirillum lusitanum]|uniref:alpha/beta fold hydrolase n=1 Tax=Herbaspirillum lusitanum TaxID=213312 RepID=UPI002237B566|nr:alpha/beta hydrolase [Herbaspirillum lusitanum]MCW5300490.1 alpha/beta hydrolase [Herbaspirillum lusitanum]